VRTASAIKWSVTHDCLTADEDTAFNFHRKFASVPISLCNCGTIDSSVPV